MCGCLGKGGERERLPGNFEKETEGRVKRILRLKEQEEEWRYGNIKKEAKSSSHIREL